MTPTRRKRRRPIPSWQLKTLWVFLIVSMLLNIGFLNLSLDYRADAKAVEYENHGMSCMYHDSVISCCKPNRVKDLLITNLTDGSQINGTLYPKCYRYQINEVIR